MRLQFSDACWRHARIASLGTPEGAHLLLQTRNKVLRQGETISTSGRGMTHRKRICRRSVRSRLCTGVRQRSASRPVTSRTPSACGRPHGQGTTGETHRVWSPEIRRCGTTAVRSGPTTHMPSACRPHTRRVNLRRRGAAARRMRARNTSAKTAAMLANTILCRLRPGRVRQMDP